MPTLNSIFSFLEAVRPDSDPCWHIRRGRLLHHYESVWVFCDGNGQPKPIILDGEIECKTVDMRDKSHLMLCLVPKWWGISLKAIHDLNLKDEGFYDRLRDACLLLVSSKFPGRIFSRRGFQERE